ncbi:MAG: 50S ribosomal protein L22 [Lewinellaceae bacterium]|nr:50S ribosomal protein L22 [Saprospiraceae bacterium]MCB9339502.1 50S ribosomal protein L22 [Lewinellaceae bacterium]
MEAVAKITNCPMSPRKMRLMANNIRGKKVGEAMNMLRFTKNESAEWLYKLLLSAVANWEYKLDGMESADDYNLYIKTIFVDEAAMLKRFRPATHGRAARIHKRRNHVTLIVENRTPLERDTEVVEVEEVTNDEK